MTENKADIITVKNLSKRYGKKVVFENLSFSLPRNRIRLCPKLSDKVKFC